MPDVPDALVELHRARSAAEAYALAAELIESGIPARVENQSLQTAPRVLVPPDQLDDGRKALEDFLARAGPAGTDADVGALRCLACKTRMDAADTCPACGWSYASHPDAMRAPDVVPVPVPASAGPTTGINFLFLGAFSDVMRHFRPLSGA
jgi:hypothetical protein